MPQLWTFYDFHELQMPNTNNELEALNSTLKAKLNLYKGISKERRKVIIQDFLKAHSPCKQRDTRCFRSLFVTYTKVCCHSCHPTIEYKSLIINTVQRVLKMTAN